MACRSVVHMYDLIGHIRQQSITELPTEFEVVLFKAQPVHGADWGDSQMCFKFLKNSKNSRKNKEYLGRFLGYRLANVMKAMSCTKRRVTVLGFGELDDDEVTEFKHPLPISLSRVRGRRRLTITLAWILPVISLRQAYRVTHLWFNSKLFIATKRFFADYRAVQRGTVQNEIFEGDDSISINEDSTINFHVNCRADASDMLVPVRYELAMTLEVVDNVNIPIYQEVRNQLVTRMPMQNVHTL